MNKTQFEKMKSELQSALMYLFRSKEANKVIDIFLKHHPVGSKVTTHAQLLVVCEFIDSIKNRKGEYSPIFSIATTENMDKNYAGIGIGIVPKSKVLLAPKRKGTKDGGG